MGIDLAPNSTVSTRLLSINSRGDAYYWNDLVDSAPFPDIYHRPGYVRAYEIAGHGKAAALLIDTGALRVLVPILLRRLSELSFVVGTTGFDAITAYGYGGLLPISDGKPPNGFQIRLVVGELQRWCRQNEVISILLRLHPLMQQSDWFAPAVDCNCILRHFGQTIALDTSSWNTTSRCITTLGKGRRSDLSFARRSLRLTWASDSNRIHQDLCQFYQLYEDRMDRLQASDFYHFPFEYYSALAEGLGNRLDVATVWLGEQPVAGAIFMADQNFAHYHLSASNELGRAHKATTLMLNEAVDWARKRGCRDLHLGGGVVGEDSLFGFKKSFGGRALQYSFLGMVCDRERYDTLVQKRREKQDLHPLRRGFFPEYRA